MFSLFIIYVAITGQGSWVDTTFVSDALGKECPVMIYLPEGYDPQGSEQYPVIYWLHGWGNHYNSYPLLQKTVMDSLITEGVIQKTILVKAEGWCEPYEGSMWCNSALYGAYEDFLVSDLIEFTEEAFQAIPDPACRSISGHSMGGTGSLDVGFRHTDLYAGIAAFAATPDFTTGMGHLIPLVIAECPETEPPYTYSWDNGYYTSALFLYSGGYSPNLSAPDSIDFLLDQTGEVIDSVYARWEEHNPAHMVKLLGSQVNDISIFFNCGTADKGMGYLTNCAFADTLNSLQIPHVYLIDSGGHSLSKRRFTAGVLFLDSCMLETGISFNEKIPGVLHVESASPNPFSRSISFCYMLSEETPVRIEIYDSSGRLVYLPLQTTQSPGRHSLNYSPNDLPSGLYIARFTDSFTSSCVKCLLLNQ